MLARDSVADTAGAGRQSREATRQIKPRTVKLSAPRGPPRPWRRLERRGIVAEKAKMAHDPRILITDLDGAFAMALRLAIGLLLLFLGCAPLVQRDLKQEYIDQAQALGLTPVYPPRGEVQVGDVYLVFTPAKGGVDEATALYVGRMTSMRDQAQAYLASRDNVGGLMPEASGSVKFGPMEQLPAINFPTITGSAASSASLGAIVPVFSGIFSAGSSDTVSVKFVDVRAFGVPFLTATIYEPDLRNTICPVISDREIKLVALVKSQPEFTDVPNPCGDTEALLKGQSCAFRIVTRTYLTREILFTYNQKRRIGASAATATRLPASTPVAAVPSVSVTIPADTPPNTAATLIDALKAPAAATTGTVGAAVVSETSQGLAFEQKFKDPLAIAYESVAIDLADAYDYCPDAK